LFFPERSLKQRGFFPERSTQVFLPDPNHFNRHRIEDDHIPFLREGTYTSHLIRIVFTFDRITSKNFLAHLRGLNAF